MDLDFRRTMVASLLANPHLPEVLDEIQFDETDGAGTVTYRTDSVWIDPSAPGFNRGRTAITDEELVRSHLLVALTSPLDYPASPSVLELERVYKPVGRPIGKGGRIDVLVRETSDEGTGRAFLFIECKAPDKFDSDLKYLDGQLFRLSRQEDPRPRYLVYYTVELKDGRLVDRVILIDTETFPDFQAWDAAGQPVTDVLPRRFGKPSKRLYANVPEETARRRPLDDAVPPSTFARLRTELHDVIWGGGGTNNNEVFLYITKLLLCKIYDEKETPPGDDYEFQRLGDEVEPEEASALVARMNELYKRAEDAYLALPEPTSGPAFDTSRISAEKLAYVVGRIEALSVTRNTHPGDLLGDFFEQIVSQDFTQTKGQFFTPYKLVRFMLLLAEVVDHAQDTMVRRRDHLGRPRLPYVIDPSCGSGTFIIEYMKLIRERLGDDAVRSRLTSRVREAYDGWFGGTGNAWAREHLFGVENNYDLGLAAKVNMVLHGDGSMNTWIASGLRSFTKYWVDGRTNILGVRQRPDDLGPESYDGELNEQFDLVITNPPFSLKLSPDEELELESVFDAASRAKSEAVFIERWYQLLAQGGRVCAVLPEAILDTSTNEKHRLFMIQHFKINAIVSLPYDAFKPFTSTKTCIVLAEKRHREEVDAFEAAWKSVSEANPSLSRTETARRVVTALAWHDEPIFLAEPEHVGYKRRKGLPDLPRPNDLYTDDESNHADAEQGPPTLRTVLDSFLSGLYTTEPHADYGFHSNLDQVLSRDGMRLDPKYRWLFDFDDGVALGDKELAVPLGDILEIVDLDRIAKGELEAESVLIDLEHVESRQGFLVPDLPIVDIIGSSKVSFQGCELAISKLEPYLGKVIINPESEWIGSTEWVGLKRKFETTPLLVIAYLLMLPELCESLRRLQSGKRHARMDPREMLHLKVEIPSPDEMPHVLEAIVRHRTEIQKLRARMLDHRGTIDGTFTAATSLFRDPPRDD